MPYPFAHPAAILPLARLRRAVPSALAIGSVIPDAWYFVPGLVRADSHSFAGLVTFCLPAAAAAYLVFHLLLKQPLLALAPPRLAAKLARFAAPGLPRAPWLAVIASMLAGAVTHVAWDALAHLDRVLQHASTLLGTVIVAAWLARTLRAAPPGAPPAGSLPAPLRAALLAAFLMVSAGWAAWVGAAEGVALSLDVAALRQAARAVGLAGVEALGIALLAYALLWKLVR